MFKFTILLFLGVISLGQQTIKLTESNFEGFVKHFDYLLVDYYAPWCGHCQRLAPSFEEASQELFQNQTKPLVALASVDCTSEAKLCNDIHSYPTLRVFINGDDFVYSGGRETKDIVYWMRRRIQGGTSEIHTEEEFLKHTRKNPLVVVYFSNSYVATTQFGYYQKVSFSFPTLTFLHTFSKELKQKFSPQNEVALFAHHFQEVRRLIADINEANLFDFVEQNRYANVMNFSEDVASRIFEQRKPALLLFYKADNSQNMLNAKQEFLDAAIFENLQTVLVDTNEIIGDRLAKILQISFETLPTIRIIKPEGETPQDVRKYVYEETSIRSQKIVTFVQRYLDGKIHPTYMSEEIPQKDFESGIRVLVSNNYEQIINDVTKDILVFYYAPWCGHCKALLPVLVDLAQQLRTQQRSRVYIAKIDATQNEIPNLHIDKFPSLYLFQATDKQNPIAYDGDRTEEGLLRWLNGIQNGETKKQSDL